MDKSQRKEMYSSARLFLNQRIPVRIDAKHVIAHKKIMIIDGEVIITGRFNFTKAAEENNVENLLLIHGKKLASLWTRNFQNQLL